MNNAHASNQHLWWRLLTLLWQLRTACNKTEIARFAFSLGWNGISRVFCWETLFLKFCYWESHCKSKQLLLRHEPLPSAPRESSCSPGEPRRGNPWRRPRRRGTSNSWRIGSRTSWRWSCLRIRSGFAAVLGVNGNIIWSEQTRKRSRKKVESTDKKATVGKSVFTK